MDDQREAWDKTYSQGLTWRKETVSLPKVLAGKTVLELGVGTGKTLKAVILQRPKNVTCVDFSSVAIERCKKQFANALASFKECDVTDLPFPSGSFDAVVCYYTLNNIPRTLRTTAVSEMHRVLKHSGIVLFEDFGVGDFREKEPFVEAHTVQKKDGIVCHFFSEDEIMGLFADFTVESLSTRHTLPIARKHMERVVVSGLFKR